MSSGSIYVCFLCEREFLQVSHLQDHMTQHGDLPEMQSELPARKKAKNKQHEEKKNSNGSTNKKLNDLNSKEVSSRHPVSKENGNVIDTSHIKVEPKSYIILKSKAENCDTSLDIGEVDISSHQKDAIIESSSKNGRVEFLNKGARFESSNKDGRVESSDKDIRIESFDKDIRVKSSVKECRVESFNKECRLESFNKDDKVLSSNRDGKIESSSKNSKVESSSKSSRVESINKKDRDDFSNKDKLVESSNKGGRVESSVKLKDVNSQETLKRNNLNKNKEKKEKKQSSLQIVHKIKPDPDEFNLAMQRAMKIKKYIERKENTAKRKREIENQEEIIDHTNGEEETEFDGPQESIMMVDSSFFSSGGSKTPVGPTIMNAEPEGFMVPQKVNSALSQPQKKKRKIRVMNENFIVQEIYYDGPNPEDLDSLEFEPSLTSNVNMFSPKDNAIRRGKGKGTRGKRGRPAKIKEEHIDESSIGYYKEVRPGRRSKPRHSMEERINGQTYQCLECYKEFRSVSTMKVHMKSHAEHKEIPCPYCDEVFPQRYILYEHLINDHEESSSLTCPICNKIFTRPDSLKSHMVRMHDENGGLNCFVCGKNFPSQGQLEMHVRVHTGERPFKCDLCSKGFVQKVHLRTHLRTMHNLTETNDTPCRLCDQKCDGRTGLRDHYMAEHGITTAQYKNQVAKLRKEGKIPEIIPPKVKVVDPSFRYQKVSVSDVKDVQPQEPVEVQKNSNSKSTRNAAQNGKAETKDSIPIYLTRGAGRKFKITTRPEQETSTPGMGTVMNLVSDDMMFTPVNFNVDSDQPKGRDQEELNIVESAFKVAEEMDQLKDGSSATILMADDSSSSSIYYSLPIDEDDDEEYAQFAAEHAHIGLEQDEAEINSEFGTQSTRSSRRGAIVKAEPLEIYSDNMGTSQAVEMLTM